MLYFTIQNRLQDGRSKVSEAAGARWRFYRRIMLGYHRISSDIVGYRWIVFLLAEAIQGFSVEMLTSEFRGRRSIWWGWRIWSTAQNQLWQLRQPAPPLVFPGEQGIFTDMYIQIREEEQVISLQFLGSQQDVSKRRRKKRKQVDDGTAIV